MGNPYRIIMHETGGTDVLKVEEFEPRPPGPGEALVKQAASGLNFIDTYFRTGLYPVKLPFVQGSEGAGTVEAVGEDAVLALERAAFMRLVREEATLQRMEHTLGTGRPLRN